MSFQARAEAMMGSAVPAHEFTTILKRQGNKNTAAAGRRA